MRPIERVLVLLILIAVPFTVAHPNSLGVQIGLLSLPLLLLLHAWVEGPHWQMGPAYAAILLLLAAFTPLAHFPAARWTIAVAAALLALASIAFCFVLPMFQLPRPTGQFPVGTRTLYLADPERSEMHPGAWPGAREVVVQLWYPSAAAKGKNAAYRRWKETSRLSTYQAVLRTHSLQDAPVAAGRFPVILYNPGWLGFRNRSTFMTQELASHGFIVAAISHPYNSSKVELSGGRIAIGELDFDLGFSQAQYVPLNERLRKANSELTIQVDDCCLVLNELERLDRTTDHPLHEHVQMSAVGAYGHSYGVAVSAELAKQDERVRAVLGLDGVLHGTVAEAGLEKPFMMIDSIWISSVQGHHDDSHPHRAAETTRMWKDIADSKDATLARHGGYRIVIDKVTHANFSDTGFMSPLRRFSEVGPLDHRLVARIINEYAVAFSGRRYWGTTRHFCRRAAAAMRKRHSKYGLPRILGRA